MGRKGRYRIEVGKKSHHATRHTTKYEETSESVQMSDQVLCTGKCHATLSLDMVLESEKRNRPEWRCAQKQYGHGDVVAHRLFIRVASAAKARKILERTLRTSSVFKLCKNATQAPRDLMGTIVPCGSNHFSTSHHHATFYVNRVPSFSTMRYPMCSSVLKSDSLQCLALGSAICLRNCEGPLLTFTPHQY